MWLQIQIGQSNPKLKGTLEYMPPLKDKHNQSFNKGKQQQNTEIDYKVKDPVKLRKRTLDTKLVIKQSWFNHFRFDGAA